MGPARPGWQTWLQVVRATRRRPVEAAGGDGRCDAAVWAAVLPRTPGGPRADRGRQASTAIWRFDPAVADAVCFTTERIPGRQQMLAKCLSHLPNDARMESFRPTGFSGMARTQRTLQVRDSAVIRSESWIGLRTIARRNRGGRAASAAAGSLWGDLWPATGTIK